MKEIVLQLHKKDFETLGSVRTLGHLQVAEDEQHLWVKGIAADNIPLKVRKLPAIETYQLDDQLRLFPVGKITPVGKLKTLNWQVITDFITIDLPKAAFAGKTNLTQPIKLVSSEKTKIGNALLCDLSVWKKSVEGAASIRLGKIKYAVSEHQKVLIIGTPLIPIPGKEFWQRGNILLPNGFDFEFPILAEVIEQQLNPDKNAIVLFFEDGSWEKILNKNFVKGSRSGVRSI